MVRILEENKDANVEEEDIDGSLEFTWGSKKGRTNKGSHTYKSFRFDGVEYFLHDCVYLWDDETAEPSIGKLIQIWETPAHEKKVKVVWFFRPIEIQHWLGNVEPLGKEIFLASGEGEGLSNINPLEAISGKCNVICTSNDKRNVVASAEELRRADYIFYRTFNVDTYVISEKFPDVIAGHDVKLFFNQKKDPEISDRPVIQASTVEVGGSSRITNPIKKQDLKIVAAGSSKHSRFCDEDTIARHKSFGDKDGIGTVKTSYQLNRDEVYSSSNYSQPPKKRKLQGNPVESKDDLAEQLDHKKQLLNSKGSVAEEKRPTAQGNFAQKGNKDKETGQGDKGGKAACQIEGITRRPDMVKDKSINNILQKASNVSGKETGQCDKSGKVDSQIMEVMRSSDAVYDKSILKFSEKEKKGCGKEMGHSGKGGRAESGTMEVKRRPDVDRSNWFEQKVAWEERMHRAHEIGSLVLLENLDPSYTSSEVEDIIWHALEMKVSAKMVQRSTFSSPHCGQAYVIFRTKAAAESALCELNEKCLMLSGGRPVVARRGTLKEFSSSKPSKFPGHIVIDKLKLKRQREEMRNAVSTSHCSQPNTVEYDMAVEWKVLQEKSRLWWDALNKQQAKEIEDLRVQLNSV